MEQKKIAHAFVSFSHVLDGFELGADGSDVMMLRSCILIVLLCYNDVRSGLILLLCYIRTRVGHFVIFCVNSVYFVCNM